MIDICEDTRHYPIKHCGVICPLCEALNEREVLIAQLSRQAKQIDSLQRDMMSLTKENDRLKDTNDFLRRTGHLSPALMNRH